MTDSTDNILNAFAHEAGKSPFRVSTPMGEAFMDTDPRLPYADRISAAVRAVFPAPPEPKLVVMHVKELGDITDIRVPEGVSLVLTCSAGTQCIDGPYPQ